jgi:hydrogenase nickel incorporation protein HypA/HybF
MHELAVTESILDIASRHGREAGANKVTDIYIVIGQISSVIDDSVKFYWDMICDDTICEGSNLHFQRIPAEILCLDCQNSFGIETSLTPCPECNSANIKLIAGDEFQLESIEISK